MIYFLTAWIALDIAVVAPFAFAAWRRSQERVRYQRFLGKLLEV